MLSTFKASGRAPPVETKPVMKGYTAVYAGLKRISLWLLKFDMGTTYQKGRKMRSRALKGVASGSRDKQLTVPAKPPSRGSG